MADQETQSLQNKFNSNEEDFEIGWSDEELEENWEPKPEEIATLFETLDRDKFLSLDWECPERRPPTPEDSMDFKLADEDLNLNNEDDKPGFEFEEESSPLKKLARPSLESGPRGSAKKKTTNLDDILSNMARHRKLDMMEDDDDLLL